MYRCNHPSLTQSPFRRARGHRKTQEFHLHMFLTRLNTYVRQDSNLTLNYSRYIFMESFQERKINKNICLFQRFLTISRYRKIIMYRYNHPSLTQSPFHQARGHWKTWEFYLHMFEKKVY